MVLDEKLIKTRKKLICKVDESCSPLFHRISKSFQNPVQIILTYLRYKDLYKNTKRFRQLNSLATLWNFIKAALTEENAFNKSNFKVKVV